MPDSDGERHRTLE